MRRTANEASEPANGLDVAQVQVGLGLAQTELGLLGLAQGPFWPWAQSMALAQLPIVAICRLSTRGKPGGFRG